MNILKGRLMNSTALFSLSFRLGGYLIPYLRRIFFSGFSMDFAQRV